MPQTPFATARGDLMPIQAGDLPAPLTGITTIVNSIGGASGIITVAPPLLMTGNSLGFTQQYPLDVSGGSPPSGITANALIAREAAQCGYFQFSSATLCQFVPLYGDLIKINGFLYQIPAGGINFPNTNVTIDGVAGQNLAANTNYYAYVFNNGGTLTAEFSTTGHQIDTTVNNVGNVVKSANGTRTLVGGVLTNASAQFQDTTTQRFVVSWINRKPRPISQSFGNNNNTSVNGTVTQVLSGFFGFWAWPDVPAMFTLEGQANDNCATGNAGAIGFGDNTTSSVFVNQFIFGTNGIFVPYTLTFAGLFAEGGHDIFINGYANTAAAAATISVVNNNVWGTVWG